MKIMPLLIIVSGMTLLGAGMMKPRGIRNNNPGNIRHSSTRWQGMRDNQTDKEFVQFTSPEYGIRALYRVLLTYQTKYGLSTIAEIITRWAPPSENDTEAYIKSVSSEMNINPHVRLNFFDYLSLLAAIIKHENGVQPYSNQQIIKGVSLA